MKAVLPAVILGVLPALGYADDCRVSEDRQAEVGAAGASAIRIKTGAGRLTVQGRPGQEVRVRGRSCATHAERLKQLTFVVERRGGTVVVEAGAREDGWDDWRGSAWTDLEVEVPKGVALEVEDGSGGVEIRDVGALRITDGSGGLSVSGVEGPLRVHDGSGSIDIRNVSGEVRVHDGSGEIEVRDVESLVVEADGSGSIEVHGVRGEVRVDRDGSGSIEVDDVGGDFVVGRDGSGGIRHAHVRGRVRIPEDN
jgi:hypothetical protein